MIGMPQYSGTRSPHGDAEPARRVTQRFFAIPSRQSLPSPTHTTKRSPFGQGPSTVALFTEKVFHRDSAVNLSLFKDKVFLSGTLIGGVMFAMLMAVTFILPVFMQTLLAYDAMQSGLALMPRSIVMFFAVPIVGRIYNKIQPRFVVPLGRHALKHFAPAAKIGEVHGTLVDGRLFPLYHPAAAMYNQSLRETLFSDARELRATLERGSRRPPRSAIRP